LAVEAPAPPQQRSGLASWHARSDRPGFAGGLGRLRHVRCGGYRCIAAAETRIHVATQLVGGWPRGPVCADTGTCAFAQTQRRGSADCVGGAMIAFPKSDRPDSPRAGDAHGDEGMTRVGVDARVLGHPSDRPTAPLSHASVPSGLTTGPPLARIQGAGDAASGARRRQTRHWRGAGRSPPEHSGPASVPLRVHGRTRAIVSVAKQSSGTAPTDAPSVASPVAPTEPEPTIASMDSDRPPTLARSGAFTRKEARGRRYRPADPGRQVDKAPKSLAR
jgi:hypothetical protein